MITDRLFAVPLAAVAVLTLAACSGSPATPVSADSASSAEPVEVAPTFTQEEKDNMTQEEKVAIYNANQEEDKNKVICHRRRMTGSHMLRTVCKTVAERELDRQTARETLHDVSLEGFACDPAAPACATRGR